MAPDFVLVLQAVFFFIELAIYQCICNVLLSDCPSNDKTKTAKTTYYHGTIQYSSEYGSKKCQVFIYFVFYQFFCQSRVLYYLLHTTKNYVNKV